MTRKTKRLLITLIAAIFLSGCGASSHYSQVRTGTIHGKPTVKWVNSDRFIFIPDPNDPFKFERYNGEEIIPNQKIKTDGGSIPRLFWIFRSYSPWGYAPAYIIHDWLYETKQCNIPGYSSYDHIKAAWVMSEVVKTLMEDPDFLEHPHAECLNNGSKTSLNKNKRILYSLYKAVKSKRAKDSWDNGCCEIVP